jgi:outer membrane protein
MKKYSLFLFFIFFFSLQAQRTISLKQAIEEGLKNDLTLRNANLDLEKTKQTNRQISGTALPQITASGNFVYNYNKATSLLPDFLNPNSGMLKPNSDFVQNYIFGGQIEATQVLFDSSLLVALQAKKTVVALSVKNVKRSEIELKESIIKAYYNVLIAHKRMDLLEENLKNLIKNKNNIEQLYKNGFTEKLDVDKLSFAVKKIQAEKSKTEQLISLAEDLLKFQIGIEINQKIVLTDQINEQEINEVAILLAEEIKAENIIEYDLLSTKLKIDKFKLKRHSISFIPTLAAFVNYGYNGPTNDFNNVTFFKQGAAGVSIQAPIFTGLVGLANKREAAIEVEKTKNELELLKKSIELKQNQLRTNLTNALESYKIEKENCDLAQKIYNQTQKKYMAGMGSTSDILDVYKDWVEAQTNLQVALYNVITYKTDYLKALNKL